MINVIHSRFKNPSNAVSDHNIQVGRILHCFDQMIVAGKSGK